ncbi:MAG: hypothetical protein IPM14_04690 [bacterium]|nr:hypothetical protein [bacterium]
MAQRQIILTDFEDKFPINPYTDILFDETKKLTLEDVAYGKAVDNFRPMENNEASLGYRNEAIWLRFNVKNNSEINKKWLLNLNYGGIDNVCFYVPSMGNIYFEKRAGIAYPINEREVEHRLIVFPIFLNKFETETYFIRIESGRSIPININIIVPEVFYKNEGNEYLIRGVFYGGLIILALYNLFLFFSIRDISYLLYFFYSLAICYYLANTDGFAFLYLSLNLGKYNMQNGIVVVSMMIILGSLFSREYLQVKNTSILIDKIFIFFIIFSMIYVSVILITETTDTSLTTYLGLSYFIFLATVCIYLSFKGNVNAIYYTIAVSFLIIGIIFRALRNIGLLSISFLTDYGVQIGMLMEMTILSFALGNRINEIKRSEEKEKASIRSRIASDLHDEIGSNLSSISVASQMLVQSRNLQEKEKQQLDDITATAKESVESIRDIIWFINPSNDNPVDIIQKMKETATKMLPDTNYNFICKDCKILDGRDLGFRRNLFLIYKEILNNIVKHSQATNVSINIFEKSDKIILEIEDDGIGFDINKISDDGLGLKNIIRRAESLGGNATVTSLNPHGTTWQIVV